MKIWPWLTLFLIFVVFFEHRGGVNPDSRRAALYAMAEDHTFNIDHYWPMTIDWSRTPDGHYYSNKAPGPVLMAFPIFWLMDFAVTHGLSDRGARDRARHNAYWPTMKILSILFQALPLMLLTLFAARYLKKQGGSNMAIHATTITILFGNMVAVYQNTFFGHAFAGVWCLALCLALLHGNFFWVGMAFGWALLSEYGVVMLIPPLIASIFLASEKGHRARAFFWVLLGGTLPGVLWIWYHTACFGSPFALPNKFQNPVFVDVIDTRYSLWGILRFFPEPKIILELLFGTRRGILWTNPWLLVVLPAAGFLFLKRKMEPASRILSALLIPGFFLMLLMNASFGGWHGGGSFGPRYLSPIFPCLALLMGMTWDSLATWVHRLLMGGILVSALFALLVNSTSDLTPFVIPLWPHYVDITLHPVNGMVWSRLAAGFLGFFVMSWFVFRSNSLHKAVFAKDLL